MIFEFFFTFRNALITHFHSFIGRFENIKIPFCPSAILRPAKISSSLWGVNEACIHLEIQNFDLAVATCYQNWKKSVPTKIGFANIFSKTAADDTINQKGGIFSSFPTTKESSFHLRRNLFLFKTIWSAASKNAGGEWPGVEFTKLANDHS